MSAVGTLASCAWLASSLPAWRRYERALCHPAETQWRILRRLLADNAATSYGRAHGFSEIRSYAQFQKRVPVVCYDELEPWIRRITHGDAGVLTRDPVTRLIPTSGSSGARKLIPFTGALQREFNDAIGPWMIDLTRQHPDLPLGPSYWSISPGLLSAAEDSAVPIGFDDDSAYLGGIRQRLVESTFAVPSVLRSVEDMECFRYLTLLCLLRQPALRLVSVWHPSFLTLLLTALPGCWDELLADIANGGCRRAATLPDAVRRAVRARSDRGRARDLGDLDPAEPHTIWPHLRVLSCWGDGQAGLALNDLHRRLPQATIQPKGLLATEAFVSIPFRNRHPLAITSHFYEFAETSGAVRLAHELRSGETYSVIVTTAGGLWRYRLGDLVEVDDFIEGTPSLRFLGRGGSVSDVCGEKLSERFVTTAIQVACAAVRASPAFAMLAPECAYDRRWNYTLFAEGEPPAELVLRLEKELRANPHYALCRDLGQLGPLRCCAIEGPVYEIFCQVSLGEGRRLGDIKPQALSLRTDWRSHFEHVPSGQQRNR